MTFVFVTGAAPSFHGGIMEIDHELVNCSMLQCCQLVDHASNIVTNTFAAGGRAISLRVGNWVPSGSDNWVPGYDAENDKVTLDAVVDVSPLTGHEGEKLNPFEVPLWPTHSGEERRASTILDVFGSQLQSVPLLQEPVGASVVLNFKSIDPFYAIGKAACDFFAMIVARGGDQMGASIFRSEMVVETVPQTRVTHNAAGEEQRGTSLVDESIVPFHLVVKKAPEVRLDDITSIRSREASYDPTWIVSSMLQGEYKKAKTYHSEGAG